MNLDLDVREIQAQVERLRDMPQLMRYPLATALTRTAVQVRKAVQDELPRSLDRPTPYTVRQLRYVAAAANRLVAAVGFNVVAISDERGAVLRYQDLGPGETPAGKYLQAQIEGGSRRVKRLEVALRAIGVLPSGWFIVPGAGARIDAYGNVSRGQVVQVLSQLRVQLVAGSTRNMSRVAGKQIAAQRKAGGRFFVTPPGKGKGQPGIYQREFYGRNTTPVFIFVRGAQYRPRFDFYGLSRQVADQTLPREVARAVGEFSGRLLVPGAKVQP